MITLRVIAGTHRSRKLEEVESINTRETKDRVKESIFNSISSYIYDATVLDLFSGSGSLGIEALSRGAEFAHFNDYGKTPYEVTNRNLKTLNLTNQSITTNLEYKACLQSLHSSFDVILLDPPYHLDVIEDIVDYISKHNLLNEDGIIVYLSSKTQKIPNNEYIKETKSKNIGITKVTYMKWS